MDGQILPQSAFSGGGQYLPYTTYLGGYGMPPSSLSPTQPLLTNVPTQQATPQSGGISIPNLPGSNLLGGNFNWNSSPISGTWAGNAIDQIGTNFGFQSPTAVGPFQPGQGTLSSTFTPGAALGGYAGNFLGNTLFGDDRRYADIGGAAGGIVGGAIGAGMAVGGPVGAAIGAFAGNALAGMFGPGRPHPASSFGTWGSDEAGLNADGTISGFHPEGSQNYFQSKHIDDKFAENLHSQLNSFTATLGQLSGLDMSGINSLQGGVDDGRGFISLGDYKQWDENTFQFSPDNQDDYMRAQREYGIEVLNRVNGLNNGTLTPEQIAGIVDQATQLTTQSQLYGGQQGYLLGEPMVAGRSNVGNETFADFMTRYRETGATNPEYRDNPISSPYLNTPKTTSGAQPQQQQQGGTSQQGGTNKVFQSPVPTKEGQSYGGVTLVDGKYIDNKTGKESLLHYGM